MKDKKSITLAELRDQMAQCFSLSELRNLCFDLGVNYDAIPGETIQDKSRELIGYCNRRGNLQNLSNRCKELRPNFAWLGDVFSYGKMDLAEFVDELDLEIKAFLNETRGKEHFTLPENPPILQALVNAYFF